MADTEPAGQPPRIELHYRPKVGRSLIQVKSQRQNLGGHCSAVTDDRQEQVLSLATTPERMKPDPYGVRERVSILDADNTKCTLVGDTQADVLAGLPAGVTVMGY